MGWTVGLPRMHKERGERRDFLPQFVHRLDAAGAATIVLEHGYGAGMGIRATEYERLVPDVRFTRYEDCLEQDIVLVVRCPDTDALRRMRPGSVLVSMLHHRTRPDRADLLNRLRIEAVSLDAVVDDAGRRLVQNLDAVAWNGVRAAFKEIQRLHPSFAHPSRRPLLVTCLGSGAVGGLAAHAATRYGDPQLREELVSIDVPGVEVTIVDFDLTKHEDYMLGRLERTDLLIDATQRLDPSTPVIPNAWLAALPTDAVILDLAADPYDFEADPPVVKGIEGIPHGDLDRYVFAPDDPAYDRLDRRIHAANRRVALSCYSWPGLFPQACMDVYGRQLEPVMELLLAKRPADLDPIDGSQLERAVARGDVSRWISARA